MTLAQKQQAFAVLVARLILEIDKRGWKVTFGEAYRGPIEAARLAKLGKGIARSLHTERLAIDLNLFKNGVYQDQSEAYAPLGFWWKEQSLPGLECAWGGDFKKPDGNHFSVEHDGRR